MKTAVRTAETGDVPKKFYPLFGSLHVDLTKIKDQIKSFIEKKKFDNLQMLPIKFYSNKFSSPYSIQYTKVKLIPEF